MKVKIDRAYADKPEKKLLAYGLYFGVITGLRRGNFAGLRVENLFPDAKVPYFLVRDNIISGRSRGKKGYITQKDATKTSAGKPIAIQMIQPSVEIIAEVARYLKAHLNPQDRLYPNKPGQIAKTWKRIAIFDASFQRLTYSTSTRAIDCCLRSLNHFCICWLVKCSWSGIAHFKSSGTSAYSALFLVSARTSALLPTVFTIFDFCDFDFS